MDGWLTIILLVLVGLVLIYLELIFVPGTTILGLIGLVVAGMGIYIAFDQFGSNAGIGVLAGALFLSIVALVISIRTGTWEKITLKTQITSKVNLEYTAGLQLEMKGVTLSDLKPIGTAEFNNKSYEVKSKGRLIEAETEVKIIKISNNKIIVEPINT